jgi:uncharacterized protein (DUF2147 family)
MSIGTPLRVLSLCAAALLAPGVLAAPTTHPASPLGAWMTANGQGVVEIAQCGEALCGRIVGIDRGPNEPMPRDAQGRSQCGLMIIANETPEPDGTWLGQVIDPRDGGSYQAKLWVDAHAHLRLRAFIGIPELGATQIWHRFTGHLAADCRFYSA